jgi:CO dehydrogenase/acetyl-CoA synthase epsilon subunit
MYSWISNNAGSETTGVIQMSKNRDFSLSEQVAAAATSDVVVEQVVEQVAETAMGIGAVARKLIIGNTTATNKQVLERVLKLFPEAKTTAACIAWYRNDLVKKGLIAANASRTVLKIEVKDEDFVL